MPSVIDFTADGALNIARPPKEVLIERLNAIHGLQLDPAHFELGNPVAETGEGYDTYIWVMPVASSSWSNGMQIFYNRMALPELMQHTANVPTNGQESLYGIIDTVNAAYGVYLAEADVQDVLIEYDDPSAPETSTGRVTLRARTTSVFFRGEYTIPVNNDASHGIGTYDQEMLHFVLLHDSTLGQDTIVAHNELGEVEANYIFLHNAAPVAAQVKTMWKNTDGTLTLVGNFDITPPAELGLNPGVYKVLWLDTTGGVVAASPGNLFGADYTSLAYFPFPSLGKVFVIDKGNEIGGNLHQVHVYTWAGDYDNSFSTSLTQPVQTLLAHEDKLYVATFDETTYSSWLHRLALTGEVDVSFPAVELKLQSMRDGVDYCLPVALSASEVGVAASLEVNMRNADFGGKYQPWEIYADDTSLVGHCVPVVFVNHTGEVDTTFGRLRPYHSARRLGVVKSDSPMACSNHAVLYAAHVTSPITGAVTEGVVGALMDGKLAPTCTQTVAALYPYFAQIKAIYTVTQGDFLVAANVYDDDHELRGALFFFSSDGVLATRELYLENHQIKTVISHAFI